MEPSVPKTAKANNGLTSKVSNTGGIMFRNRFKTPLYMSSHLDSPAATTVSGVLRTPLGRSRSAAKKRGPAMRSRPGWRRDCEVGRRERVNWRQIPEIDSTVVMVRVDSVSREDRVSVVLGVLRGRVGEEVVEEALMGRRDGDVSRRDWWRGLGFERTGVVRNLGGFEALTWMRDEDL
ncbi:hypothetical protein QYF36_018175 [Acer negundo]|nr:hypothetical protein QYF36_018175 [Acer negundo]